MGFLYSLSFLSVPHQRIDSPLVKQLCAEAILLGLDKTLSLALSLPRKDTTRARSMYHAAYSLRQCAQT